MSCLELDVRCEACQRFFKEGLTTSFVKILTDEAVSGWKMEIHVCITEYCSRRYKGTGFSSSLLKIKGNMSLLFSYIFISFVIVRLCYLQCLYVCLSVNWITRKVSK